MTINNPELYCSGLWDWGILDGCFGQTRIKPTGIDGFVERNGHFLVLEAKAPGVPIKDGQEITFRKLAQTGLFVIMIIWGLTNIPSDIKIFSSKGVIDKKPCDLEGLRNWVTRWFNYADGV